jgi:hypothetical protein
MFTSIINHKKININLIHSYRCHSMSSEGMKATERGLPGFSQVPRPWLISLGCVEYLIKALRATLDQPSYSFGGEVKINTPDFQCCVFSLSALSTLRCAND